MIALIIGCIIMLIICSTWIVPVVGMTHEAYKDSVSEPKQDLKKPTLFDEWIELNKHKQIK